MTKQKWVLSEKQFDALKRLRNAYDDLRTEWLDEDCDLNDVIGGASWLPKKSIEDAYYELDQFLERIDENYLLPKD